MKSCSKPDVKSTKCGPAGAADPVVYCLYLFVLKRRGAYVPPTIPRKYHQNHNPGPDFPRYIKTKSASGVAAENK